MKSYTTSQMALLAAVLKHALGDEPSGAIWPILDSDNLILVTSLLATPMSSSSLLLVRKHSFLIVFVSKIRLFQFEGKLDFPNPERLWNIITKYKVCSIVYLSLIEQLIQVEKILLNNESTRLLMQKEIDMANVSARSLKVIFTVFTNQEDAATTSEWIKSTFPMAKHIAIVY